MSRFEGGAKRIKDATIYDVARSAGVSAATVSRALSRPQLVAQETLRRIEAAVAELGYLPNVAAKELRTGHHDLVAALVPDIVNPFYAQLIRRIQDGVEFAGIAVIVCSTDNRSDREVDYLELVHTRRAKAVLCGTAGASPSSDAILTRLLAKGVRVVTMGHRMDHPGITTVASDSVGGVRQAIQHLVSLGHTRIGYIGFSVPTVGRSRERGFRAAVLDLLGDADPPVTKGAGDPMSGQAAVGHWIELGTLPTGILAGNDLMAMGAMVALRDHGMHVPQDVSVVGFDDIDYAAFTRPTLTTVRQPVEQMGACVADLFVAAPPPDRPAGEAHIFPTQLIVRESTGPPPAR